MTDRIERELRLPAPPEEVWEVAVTGGRLAGRRGGARAAARGRRPLPPRRRPRPAGWRRSRPCRRRRPTRVLVGRATTSPPRASS